MASTFIAHYHCGPQWLAGKSVFEQPLQGHLAYMQQLLQQLRLLIGGPFLDDSGGLIVLSADSIDDARALVAADPAIRDQIMVAQVYPWRVMAGGEALGLAAPARQAA